MIPPSSFRAEFLEESAFCERRFLLLTEAMPTEKYAWRPAPGWAICACRDCKLQRVEAPDQERDPQPGVHSSFQLETVLAIGEDKPKIMEALKNSFANLRARTIQLSDGDEDKPQTMLNRQTTLRGAWMIIDRHLGQATTYALVVLVAEWRYIYTLKTASR